MERIREGFSGLWRRLSGLPLTVTEDGLQWEADDVLLIDDKKEGLAWALFEAGVRFLAFSPGVEEEEVSTFLAAIHRSRSFTEDDVDDLLTLLWTADFQYIRHKAPEVVPESQTTAEGERPAAATPAGSREWRTLISQLLSFGARQPTEEGIEELRRTLVKRGASTLQVGTPAEGETRFADEVERKRVARQIYEKSMAVTKDLLEGTRMGQSAHLKEVKRAVRGIVDQVLHNEVASVGLTTLNDFDRYSFAHTVNVCIFSVAIGRRLGLSKNRLFDLGMAALLHDVGKSRIPLDLVQKEGELTEEEYETVKSHTWLGALHAYRFRDYGEIPYRGMITAYEHHMKMDLSGYPATLRPRRLSVFSKIVGLAAAFDAATSTRGHAPAKPPDVVLRELREDPNQGHDRVLVKALITLLGIYPVGTCVILDTHELAIVHAANSDAALVHRPIIRLICDADGVWLDKPPLVDLAYAAPDGSFVRSIIKVTEPERYLINVSDYFV